MTANTDNFQLPNMFSNRKKLLKQHVPSEGGPANPQLYPDNFPLASESKGDELKATKRGLKRKRTDSKDLEMLEILEAPNFFATSEGRPGLSQVMKAKQQKTHTIVAKEGLEALNISQVTASCQTEEECRRILKSHKLKVTVIEMRETQGSKTRHNKTSKKVAFKQIFPQPLASFKELRARYAISKRLAENLETQGYIIPTEVQLGSLPLLLGSDADRGLSILEDKSECTKSNIDFLAIAPTGSGKTLSFLIPVFHGLIQDRYSRAKAGLKEQAEVRAIVMAPTHELADQIVNEAKKLAVGTGIKVCRMRKGMKMDQGRGETTIPHLNAETAETKDSHFVKSDVLITTPLMLLHSMTSAEETSPQELSSILYLVLDEADVLLDPLFRDQTLAIWRACTGSTLQVSLWSATIGSSIETLAKSVIAERRKLLGLPISNHRLLRLVAGLKDSALPTISHRLVYAGTEHGKLLAVRELLHPTTFDSSSPITGLRPPFLIFTQTIPRAAALHSELLYDIPLEAGGSSRIAVLHSDLSDTARSAIMANFRKGEVWVLITTDLLSRGIDFRGINGVVNYDIPNTGASYIHRAGRTGRAGREGGIAVTLYTKEDIPYVKNIANVIAASERVNGKPSDGSGVQKWLLDALPTLSKKTKQTLKKYGVEARRPAKDGKETKETRRMRISTKSGFDRRLENKKRENMARSKKQRAVEEGTEADSAEDEVWNGIED
jgi:ATP-dependent RNA helicase DDX52/ROK1